MRGANRQVAGVLAIAFFLSSALPSAGQAGKPAAPLPTDFSQWSCFTEYLAREGESDPVVYRESEQILQSVASYRALQIPCCYGNLNIAGEVKVEVVIDPAGLLRCARAVSGNPLAMQSAIQSLPTWRFRSYKSGGKRATVIGYILLPFHFLSR